MNYEVIAASIKKTIIGRKTKSLIAALLLAASSTFAQVPSYVPTNGLVGWWPFNGNANDESGNGNNGTVNGALLTSDKFGIINSAYLFNGSTDYISLSQPFFQGSTSVQEFSYHVTIKPYSLPPNSNTSYSISNKEGYWRTLALALTYDGKIWFGGSQPNSYISVNSQPNTIEINKWYDIIITYSNSTLSLFINGSLSGTSLINYSSLDFSWPALGNSTSTNLIGASNPVSPGLCNYFNGIIDDFGTWNRTLTQQEITALYNAQSCTGAGAITPDGATTFCAGNYVNLTSDVVGGSYQWKKNGVNISTNATSRTYKATATGSYTCVATCNGTALTSNAIQVTTKTNAFASVTASGATSFCAGDSVTLNCTNLGSNYSVQWYRTNISMENATNYSQVVKQPGTYKVVTKNLTNGCSRISGSAITTSVNCRIAGDITSGTNTEEQSTNEARFTANDLSQGVNVFPNPNNGTFSFTYDGEETGDGILQIMNSLGQTIYTNSVRIPEGGFVQDIALGDQYNKGIYIVRLLINGSYHDSRVMVR